jgi:hypothetical protein
MIRALTSSVVHRGLDSRSGLCFCRQYTQDCFIFSVCLLKPEFGVVFIIYETDIPLKCLGGVIIRTLTSSTVDSEFDSRSSLIKDFSIDICWFSSHHATLRGTNQRLVG